MLEHVSSILKDKCSLDNDQPILVGVSGGPDSLSLLDILHRAGYPVLVAHFNHKLRPEADDEAETVKQIAAEMGLKFITESKNVREFSDLKGLSIEAAARMLRYQFLFSQAREFKVQAVAVGHNADDQVETVLMHLVRGAGLAGLKGMPFRGVLPHFDTQIPLVRPLLDTWRDQIEAYCQERGLVPHHDPTNIELTYFRNRLRHVLIPDLKTYNPRIKEALWRMAMSLQDDHDSLEHLVESSWGRCDPQLGENFVSLDRTRLVELSVGLRRAVLRRAASVIRENIRDVGYEALDRADKFCQSRHTWQVDLAHGIYLFHEDDRVLIAAWEADLPTSQWPQVTHSHVLAAGEEIDLGLGWRLDSMEVDDIPEINQISEKSHPYQAWLDADRTGMSFTIRAPINGDRFSPLGMDGHSMKLSDFFINNKLPRRARDKWPLVCVGDEVAWVPGFRPAHQFRLTKKTRRVVYLVLNRMEG